jgi:hypothetical protein
MKALAEVAGGKRAAVILVASGLLQVAIATLPDTMGDVLQYRLWMRALVRGGLSAAYWPPAAPVASEGLQPPVDSPPLLPYLFWALGHGIESVSPGTLERSPRIVDFMIRLPLCAASLLLAWLVGAEARRLVPDQADLVLALVALNPAIVFDTAYWGQADAPCALLVVAAMLACVRGWPEWSWAALAGAALVKPLAYAFVPLVVLVTLWRYGLRRAVQSGAAASVVVALSLLPFAWLGRLGDALRAFVFQLDAMPYVSVNAHNLWWLLGRGTPWTDASTSLVGPLTWNAAGFLLLGALYVPTLIRLRRSSDPRALYVAAASIAVGFFMLSTRMHENHLFCALPLLALAGVRSRPGRVVLLVLTTTMLANMLLHDPYLTHLARPHVPGPRLLLPPRVEPMDELANRLTSLGYPWIPEEMRGETSFLGVMATVANAQAGLLAFCLWLTLAYRGRSFDGPPLHGDGGAWARPRWFLPMAAAFVLATGVPFLGHALGFSVRLSGRSAAYEVSW